MSRDEYRGQDDPPQRIKRKVPETEKGALQEGVDGKTGQILDLFRTGSQTVTLVAAQEEDAFRPLPPRASGAKS